MESRSDFTAAQAKADRVAQAFGDSAPPPLAGERLRDYRLRLLSPYLKHSKHLKAANLANVHDSNAFDVVEERVYSDAAGEALHPTAGFRPGELRAVVTIDPSGRPITRYVGDPAACWSQFQPPVRYARRILIPGTAMAA